MAIPGVNGWTIPARGRWLVSMITPRCMEGIVVRTSHKLEGLGDKLILAVRHFGRFFMRNGGPEQ